MADPRRDASFQQGYFRENRPPDLLSAIQQQQNYHRLVLPGKYSWIPVLSFFFERRKSGRSVQITSYKMGEGALFTECK